MVDHLVADGALPLVFFNPPSCNAHVGSYSGLNETDVADQNELIIIDFTFTRTFSNHNIMMTTHEKIYYKLAHSVTENTIYITSSRNQGSVSWIKRLSTNT